MARIFVIGYTILFTCNIYSYFRYRRAWTAEANDQAIFKLNHSIADPNSPRNLQSPIRKKAMAVARQASIRLPIKKVVYFNNLRNTYLQN
ncbi:hypothetical protein ACH3XW_30880 [Acanthocheilonema viteae]